MNTYYCVLHAPAKRQTTKIFLIVHIANYSQVPAILMWPKRHCLSPNLTGAVNSPIILGSMVSSPKEESVTCAHAT